MSFISFKKAKELAENIGTPLLVLSRERIKENYESLKDSLQIVDLYYAMKSNPHPDILRTIYELKGGFDVASRWEIDLIEEAGIPIKDNKIIYTNPINKEQDIKYSVEKGVKWFVFDNEWELEKFAPFKNEINLLLRLCFSSPNCVIDLSYKFGAHPDEAEYLITKANLMGLKVRGISFHVGSQNTNPYSCVDAIITCRRLFNTLMSKNIYLDTLDIGGGFPISYLTSVPPIKAFCEPIYTALEKYFSTTNIIAEPGRFISGNAVVLITKVIGKSIRNNIQWYYIDDGIYNSFSGKIYDHCEYQILTEKEGIKKPCIIAGPTCDSTDVVYSNTMLPNLELGDIIVVPDMGAYTSASATNFNGFPKAEIYTID